MGRGLQVLLSGLMAQHPEATDEQLLELYCAEAKKVPALIDDALGRCFDEDMAFIRELVLDGPEAEASWAADRGVTALRNLLEPIDDDVVRTLVLKVVEASFGEGRQAANQVLNDIRGRYGLGVYTSVVAKLNSRSPLSRN